MYWKHVQVKDWIIFFTSIVKKQFLPKKILSNKVAIANIDNGYKCTVSTHRELVANPPRDLDSGHDSGTCNCSDKRFEVAIH